MALTQAERDELYLYVGGEIRKVQEQVAVYRTSLEAMAGDIAKLTETAASKRPVAIDWQALNREEYNAKFAELCEWVKTRVPRYYKPSSALNHHCWARHPDVVDLTTVLWLTWVAAFDNPRASPTDAARWLLEWAPRLSEQIDSAMHECNRTECKLDKEDKYRPYPHYY